MRVYRGLLRLALACILPLIAALQFLTRLPMPVRLPDEDAIYRRSTVYYPAAGLLIGLITAGAACGLSYVLPFYANGVMVLGIWVYLSGGLHLDGLMDTADGLLSYRSRERMLEIMKDSRVGAMGVIACVLALMLKMMLLAALLEGAVPGVHTLAGESLVPLALLPVWSRAFLPAAIAFWPYARQGGAGLGSLYRSVRGRHAAAAFGVAAAITLAVLRIAVGSSWLDALLWCAAFAFAACLIGGAVAFRVSRKLGGLTGDVYGALNEIIELALLLGLVMYEWQWG